MNQSKLISFFRNQGTDDQGRTLSQILSKDDDWFENTHDFIQWLFPLDEKSGANPTAPLVDIEFVRTFEADDVMQRNMLLNLDRMLSFFSLEREDTVIRLKRSWDGRAYWFTTPTHNDLRISRMIRSLKILGMDIYAGSLLEILMLLSKEPECGFSQLAIEYWRKAVARPVALRQMTVQ